MSLGLHNPVLWHFQNLMHAFSASSRSATKELKKHVCRKAAALMPACFTEIHLCAR